MKSQKKSSTKVGAKNAAPTGQRQYSNLLRSQAAVVKAKNEARPKTLVTVRTKAPIAFSSQLRYKAPTQKSLPNGGLHVSHCEFIGPVYKPATAYVLADAPQLFQAMRLRMNPGSKKTFNWLSTIAPLFESFRFRKLVLHYETRCSTSDRGSIIMSPDYDAADGQIALSEQLLFSNRDTVDDTIWKHLSLRLNPATMNRLYKAHPTMSDDRFETTNQDEKTVDPAQVFICVDGDYPSQFKYGKIFIEYEVEFFDPQNPSESPSTGGFVANPLPASLTAGSTKPMNNSNLAPQFKVQDNTIIPATALPELTFPTAVLGRFAKDYQGVLSDYMNGTGLSNAISYYIGSNPLGDAGTGDDLLINMGSIVNVGGSIIRGQGRINAAEGKYLKFKTPTWTTLANYGSTASGLLATII